MVTILFARKDSAYKNYKLDVYDFERDALTYKGKDTVIAHPPCRAWGRLSHMANPRIGEKELAYFALSKVRENGGVLEHPLGSKLWKDKQLPRGNQIDAFGGFTLEIDQYDFGHVAPKRTLLYIVGMSREHLPPLPTKNTEKPVRSIAGNIEGTKRCTQYQREYTPDTLIVFLLKLCEIIQDRKNNTQVDNI